MELSLKAADGHTFSAWLTGPENARCGVVVLPEIFGINAHIRHLAEHFASHGYRVICPSLFDRATGDQKGIQLGYTASDVKRGLALRNQIREGDVLLDIEAAGKALENQAVRMVSGYCWGGTLAWRTACLSDTFAAASCWYGGGIAKHAADTPRIPVQMHFGDRDQSIPLKDIEAVKAAHPDLPIYVYPGAGHAFAREGSDAYHAESTRLAWERTFAFFAKIAAS